MISGLSGSIYSHATMIGYAGLASAHVLMLGETREHRDARLIALSNEIRHWPGYYDVYRVKNFAWNPDKAWAFVCRAAGATYSWRHMTRGGLRRLFGNVIPPIPDSDDPEWPRDCSALVHAALRAGNGPGLGVFDCDVAPGDLSHPDYFDYLATLAW